MSCRPLVPGSSSYLRTRAARCRRRARTVRCQAVGQLLRDLANYLDLEALIEDAQVDPFRNRTAARRPNVARSHYDGRI